MIIMLLMMMVRMTMLMMVMMMMLMIVEVLEVHCGVFYNSPDAYQKHTLLTRCACIYHLGNSISSEQ